ncbi:hypothetical protein B005_0395 [Nocardiopsis alba ATCC BAA-2165]|uniref:Uncharacterized protein n=1 Tax=Nocardiopsis alba (strain ATCC BAA-2165 / BE74) TaxID=1205910 RepID=J7KX85_NOCAA|nr:hypothetical protein B005_0395 [Nocardiopsis alba ATCC BAA-2165]
MAGTGHCTLSHLWPGSSPLGGEAGVTSASRGAAASSL